MNVSFIYPAQQLGEERYTKGLWKHYSKEGVVVPQLGIVYLAAILMNQGHNVCIIDANASSLSVEDVYRTVKDLSTEIMLFTSITENFANTLLWIRELKKRYSVPVIIGGPHTTLYPKSTMEHKEIDICVIGDGSRRLIDILEVLSNSHKENGLNNIMGILYRSNGEIHQTESMTDIMGTIDLDNLPLPARHLLPNDRYKTVISDRTPITSMLSSSGCPFKCVYCDTRYSVVMRDPGKVVNEMEYCNMEHGIKEILFYDETFTLNRKRAVSICDLLIEKNLDLTFSIRTRANTVDEDLIKKLAEAGCVRVNYGIESGNQGILKNLNRNIPLEEIKKAVYWTRKHGIKAFGFFMIGCPGDNHKTINETINFALSLDLDYVQFNKLTLVPNSELYIRVKELNQIDYWDEYTKGNFDIVKTMPRCNVDVTDKELDRLLKKAYLRFYYRPKFIIRQLLNIKSPGQFLKLFKAALGILR